MMHRARYALLALEVRKMSLIRSSRPVGIPSSALACVAALATLIGGACGGKSAGTSGGGGTGGTVLGTGGVANTGGGGAYGGQPPCARCPVCGDRALDSSEACDDGNSVSGDGCNALCQIEVNWQCSGDFCVRVSRCGDGTVTSDEICDDGNIRDGDGCSSDCQTIESAWYCPVPGKLCRLSPNPTGTVDAGVICDGVAECPSECGNSVVEGIEECDDGIDTSAAAYNDDWQYGGCTSKCRFGPYCGDGELNGEEECDNGAANAVDVGEYSCTLACTRRHFCGDGIPDGNLGEKCDLGELNGQPQQGCDSSCWNVSTCILCL